MVCEEFYLLISQRTSKDENREKGYALRTGVRRSTAPIIIYSDWDFPYKIKSIESLINKLNEGVDVVVSTRNKDYHTHSDLNYLRSFMSRASRIFNRCFLGLRYNDTQGGLKGMSRKGKRIFLQTRIDQFLFDTEFVYMANKDPRIKISEISAELRTDVHLSSMGSKVLQRELRNLFHIIWQ